MAEQKNRPVPKRRSVHLGANLNNELSTTDLYGSAQDVQTKTSTGQIGLPICVQQKQDVSLDQKNRDSTLPRLLYELDEACKENSNDDEKSRLANSCILAASSPNRKYRLLKFFQLLENNKNDVDKLPAALSILEKYAVNLLRDEKPQQWKEIKLSTTIIQNMVLPVHGAKDVLKQMGYTEETERALTFPVNVHQPSLDRTVVLTADLSIARHETEALLRKRHPFLTFNASSSVSDKNIPDAAIDDGGFCGVCSEQNLATNCEECDMQFCLECDDRYHCHKLRRNHIRTSLHPNKDKPEEQRPRPVPVPRRRKNLKTEDDLRNLQYFQEPAGQNEQGRATSSVRSNFEVSRPSGNQEIKRPPSRENMRLSNNMTSPDNISPDMNIHTNPSQQNQRLNALYGAYAPQTPSPYPGHDQTSQYVRSSQEFYQSGNVVQGFNQSGRSGKEFNQSEKNIQDFNQSGGAPPDIQQSEDGTPNKKVLHRVHSCPSCSLLYSESQEGCPSCTGKLNPAQQQQFLNGQDFMAVRALPDPPRVQNTAARDKNTAARDKNMENSEYEAVDDLLEWSCEHCTFANPLSTKVCQVCSKTPADLKKFPKLVEKSSPAKSMASPNVPQAAAHGTTIPPNVPPRGAYGPMGSPNVQQTGTYEPMGSSYVPQVGAYETMRSPNVPQAAAHRTTMSPNVSPRGAYEPMGSPNVPQAAAYGVQTRRQQDPRAVYMTPKNNPLEGGIFLTPGGNAPSLPPRNQHVISPAPVGKFVEHAQKYREQQLSEKEKGKLFYEEKQELHKKGLITEDELYTIDTSEELHRIVERRKREIGADDGCHIVNAQKQREQQLSEKEKRKLFYKEKQELHEKGLITEDELFTIDTPEELHRTVEGRKRGTRTNDGYHIPRYSDQTGYPGQPGEDVNQLMRLLQSGVIDQQDVINNEKALKDLSMDRQAQIQDNAVYISPRRNETLLERQEDISLSEQQLQQLLQEGGFPDEKMSPQTNLGSQPPQHFRSGSPGLMQPHHYSQGNQSPQITRDELYQLYQAGIISLDYLQNPPPEQMYDASKHEHPPVAPADIQQMYLEFRPLQTNEQVPNTGQKKYGNIHNSPFHQYNVVREAAVVQGIYEKQSLMKFASMPAQGLKNNLSSYLNSQIPLENVNRKNFIDDQSRLYVEWVKEAEQAGFTPEELNIANNLNWQDSRGRNPVEWLKDEWCDRIAEVIGRVTEQTSNENDRIGNLSTDEAKQALLENHGSVESACKASIESRREKLEKMGESSFFTRADCVNALDRNEGNVEKALLELEVKALEPIRKRVLRQLDVEDARTRSAALNQVYEQVVKNVNVSAERRIRLVLIEHNMQSWGRAEIAIRIIDMGYNVEDSIEAAKACGDLERSLAYLQQECPICFDKRPMGQMITFLSCQDKTCKECVIEYLTTRIKEMQIHQIVCPVCGLPDINDEAAAADYLNNLDIMIRVLVDAETHDLFQKKLRDRVLSKEANFRWCAHCSSGFINELPNVNKMQCPNCLKFTCFTCKKPWEDQHEGITCEEFARWKEENDEEYQLAGLAGHLARNGIDCPECKFRYDLARGGCMHFRCGQCGHEFCSGCNNPMKNGARCNVFQSCARKGLHAHHPRGCLFYLRDWEPERLQELLQENGVDYNAGETGIGLHGDENDEEIAGAVGGGQNCKVMEQKEAGIDDVECGRACYPGHDGLCRLHYTEYLVDLINKNGIDPADKMSIDEMNIVFQRSEVECPAKLPAEGDDDYRQRILEVLKQHVPLPRPPTLQAPVVVVDGEDE